MDQGTSTCHSKILIAASSLPLLPILVSILYMCFKLLLRTVSGRVGLIRTQLRSACSFLKTHVFTGPHTNLNEVELGIRSMSRLHQGQPGDIMECAVCLSKVDDGEEVTELRCTHVFHKLCLRSWVGTRVRQTCPICRSPVSRHRLAYEHGERQIVPLKLLWSRTRDRGDNFWLR